MYFSNRKPLYFSSTTLVLEFHFQIANSKEKLMKKSLNLHFQSTKIITSSIDKFHFFTPSSPQADRAFKKTSSLYFVMTQNNKSLTWTHSALHYFTANANSTRSNFQFIKSLNITGYGVNSLTACKIEENE